ncbi:DNA-directed RNA polymerase III subunit rpc6 [Phytophthora cinnamomi]|uniref:DNA-directed RNA polymerase III subunit rpc6 n=1 Tax=Phytophthora cinnamomi TaxID=4785 RepID=UPI003559F4E6|nr:DNA-directed RNA polymerase III subunit rpc6 [Phytophthora cinnamomi]
MERPLLDARHAAHAAPEAPAPSSASSSSSLVAVSLFPAPGARERALPANPSLASFPHEEVEPMRGYPPPSNAPNSAAGATSASSSAAGAAGYSTSTALQTRKRKRIPGPMRMRNFLCMHPGCGKSFTDSAHLRDHTVVHTGQGSAAGIDANVNPSPLVLTAPLTPFACQECGKHFRRLHPFRLEAWLDPQSVGLTRNLAGPVDME